MDRYHQRSHESHHLSLTALGSSIRTLPYPVRQADAYQYRVAQCGRKYMIGPMDQDCDKTLRAVPERTQPLAGNADMDRILVITQYPLPEYKRNMNQYQRNYYGANYAEIHLLVRRKCEVSQEINQRVTVHRAPVHNRVLFFLYAIVLGLWLRLKHVDVIETDASIYALVGFVLRYIGRYFWVMDVWDPVRSAPRKGQHRSRTFDRPLFRFRLMSCADLFLLSCLPPAGRQIQLDPGRCVQLYNAINLSGVITDVPPNRSEEDMTLHLALARYRLGEKEGFHVVLRAAERLHRDGISVKIHLIGHLDEDAAALLTSSPAVGLFQAHGFLEESRCDFFRSIHVGLVPYLPLWDMSYIFPIKVLEHLSQGNVVVASNLPGLAATVQHEYNGLLFEAGNSDDLAKCIRRLCEDRDMWGRLSANAIESVKKYDPEAKNRIIFQEISKRRTQRFYSRRKIR